MTGKKLASLFLPCHTPKRSCHGWGFVVACAVKRHGTFFFLDQRFDVFLVPEKVTEIQQQATCHVA